MQRTRMSLALAAAVLAVAAPAAQAAKPTASIAGGTLTVTGTARADLLALRVEPDTVDVVRLNRGDGDDVVEGQAGRDALTFTGSGAGERVDLSANGGRLRVTRNIGHVALDANDVEDVEFDPRGGADRVFVHDLTGTGVRSVDTDLAVDQFGLDEDGAPDEVTVDGTDHRDDAFIFGSDPLLHIPTAGIQSGGPFISIENPDGPLDRLIYRARGGPDRVHADALDGDVIALQLDGDGGNDTLIF